MAIAYSDDRSASETLASGTWNERPSGYRVVTATYFVTRAPLLDAALY